MRQDTVKSILKMLADGYKPREIRARFKSLTPSGLSYLLRKFEIPRFKSGRPEALYREEMADKFKKLVALKSRTEVALEHGISRQRLDQILNPEKTKARIAVSRAIKSGKIVNPRRCVECSSCRNVSAHHHDYSKPLDVKWLCSKCHKKKHPNWNKKKEYTKINGKSIVGIVGICAGDGGCGKSEDCKWVQFRVPGKLNKFNQKPLLLCPACRTATLKKWRYKI